MGTSSYPTNRRSFVASVLSTAAATALVVQPAQAALQAAQEATPGTGAEWRVNAPRWAFQLHSVQDPYAGTLQVPQTPPAGTRVVAVEIEVINDSEQPLNFTPVDVRLRDASGMEHRGGAAIGTEPMINPRNMNPGELSRGWVWFLIPEDADATEVVYVAPQPQFRVLLP